MYSYYLSPPSSLLDFEGNSNLIDCAHSPKLPIHISNSECSPLAPISPVGGTLNLDLFYDPAEHPNRVSGSPSVNCPNKEDDRAPQAQVMSAQIPNQTAQPQPEPEPLVSIGPDDNGILILKGNLEQWIKNNPTSHRVVKRLVLNFSGMVDEECEIGQSIVQLPLLTHLEIKRYDLDYTFCRTLPLTMPTLRRDRNLLYSLPANFGVLNNMTSLTHLTLSLCKIKSLPESIATLPYLTSVHLKDCHYIEELPLGLEQLGGLKHFSFESCNKLKSLPNTLSNLLHLDTLHIKCCDSLTELPSDLKVSNLHLIHSSIKFIPRGLTNLRHLAMDGRLWRDIVKVDISKINANLNQLHNLQILSFHPMYDQVYAKLSGNLKELRKLILLDIQDTIITYIPWSITQLNLKILMLPREFRLETLPFNLKDSVLISVKGRHVRKTWKQLGISKWDLPIAQDEYPSNIGPPGYLSLQSRIRNSINRIDKSYSLVKMLDLLLPNRSNADAIKKTIEKLPNLTHLYVTDADNMDFLPQTIMGLKHLCPQSYYNHKSSSLGLSELANLETLDLIDSKIPMMMNLPFSLRRLSLRSHIRSFPDNMVNLSNLHTLELNGYYHLTSLPSMNIVHLKINRIIGSLPISLRHLEILHSKSDCFDKFLGMSCDDNGSLEKSLTQLVNLEMLSLTCYRIESLPSLAKQRNLQVLLLKDCFALKELQPDLEQLVELQTLDISGTRIKSLPDSILELSKLQQLILPNCFTQKVPMDLKEVSIIDDTDRRYYEHMGYYDSGYESSYEGNDVVGGPIEGVNDASTEDPIQGDFGGQAFEQDDVIRQVPRDSHDTGSRDRSDGYNHHAADAGGCSDNSQQAPQNDGMCNMNGKNEQENAPCDTSNLARVEETEDSESDLENGQYMLPQSENVKKNTQKIYISEEMVRALLPRGMTLIDAAKELSVSRSTLKRRLKGLGIKWPPSKQGKQKNNAKRRKLNSETTNNDSKESAVDKSTLEPSLANVKEIAMAPQCNKAGHQLIEQQLNGSDACTLLNIVQEAGISNPFTVKATYHDDTVKFKFSLKHSIEELEQEVGKRLKLKVGTFRMKYKDEDEDLIRISCTSELEEPLRLSRSSGLNFVKLSITDERSLHGAHKRQTSEEIHEHLTLKTEGEKFNQYSNNNQFPFQEDIASCILPFIERYTEVKGDGHCGFRTIAIFQYRDEEKWLDVRHDLMEELTTHQKLYERALGGEDEFKRACSIVNYFNTPAPVLYWYEATALGLVVATKYQKICTHCSKQCPTTFLPLETRLVDQPPTEYINMALVRSNHFIALHMTTSNIPLPRLMPLWEYHCNDEVKSRFLSHFEKQLGQFANDVVCSGTTTFII